MSASDQLRNLHAEMQHHEGDSISVHLLRAGRADRIIDNALTLIADAIAAAEKAHVEHSPSCCSHPYASHLPFTNGPCDHDCQRETLRRALAALDDALKDTQI